MTLKFMARRVAVGVVILCAVCLITYALLYLRPPTSIAQNLLGPDANESEVAAKVRELGLDRPFLVQFRDWVVHAITGDLGASYGSSQPVIGIMSTRLPITLSLVTGGLLVVGTASVAVGVIAATRGGAIDRALQVFSIAAAALPNYWVALVLVVVFALNLSLFPATGFVPPDQGVGRWLASITLPVVAIAVGGIANVAQQVRGAMLGELRQDYIRTLRSRGISERAIVYRHALRNAASAGLTVLSLQVIGLLGGVVIIERVFALPGLGTLLVDAGSAGDVPIVMGVVAFMVLVVVVVNTLVDLLNGLLDPKARVS
ncbi:ABC transporter permease [Ruania alba]|uniref:Peptide/nickel transport system permease protein n=1 Tax=Ruania alba TaxID=648782 RepID=A0A1H5N8T2_9MICO|nr:ABC transporter permease [Ruania alba]SEE97068.1 peptide/nickel transport system permease protein [Ruania alba]